MHRRYSSGRVDGKPADTLRGPPALVSIACAFSVIVGTSGCAGASAPNGSAGASVAIGNLSQAHPSAMPLVGPFRPNGGARYVPEQWELPTESPATAFALGAEAGGGIRSFAGGERIALLPGGAIVAADSPFASRPSSSIALPDRLGGGFAFAVGTSVWRADRWLGPARPLVSAGQAIDGLEAGMDRLYIHLPNGARAAIDPRTGAARTTALPKGPSIAAYAALDGWRAAAIVDLRGLVATHDAGATWQTVEVPGTPRELVVDGGTIAVRADANSTTPADATNARWFALGDARSFDHVTARAAPSIEPHLDSSFDATSDASDARPLSVAIDDGWPLDDGTALLLRDGAFSRVRSDDGARVETWDARVVDGTNGHLADASDPLPARCHPLSLGHHAELGFVCGSADGERDTQVLRYDAASRSLVAIGRFAGARAVSAPGNGSVVVRGACSGGTNAAPLADADAAHVVCILDAPRDPQAPNGTWRELRIAGAADGERVIPLESGAVAVLSPARGDLSRMRLTLLEGTNVRTVALRVHASKAQPSAPLDHAVAGALRDGVWLDGVQTPLPGELAAWVDAHGTMLGLRIRLDGDTAHGPWVRDLGGAIVSGLYGFGMSASHRGYETIDGGMTWTAVETPTPLVPLNAVTHRSCGPLGCNAGGWLRLGWGAAPTEDDVAPPASMMASIVAPEERTHAAAPLPLTCRVTGALPAPPAAFSILGEPSARIASQLIKLASASSTQTGAPLFPDAALPTLLHAHAPAFGRSERGFSLEAMDANGASALSGPFALVYAWGNPAGNWDDPLDADASGAPGAATHPHWLVRWAWPYGADGDLRSSALSAAPRSITALTSVAGAANLTNNNAYVFVASEDADHGLIVGLHSGPANGEIYELETGRAPLAITDEHGDPLPDVRGAARVSGHWYIATNAPGTATNRPNNFNAVAAGLLPLSPFGNGTAVAAAAPSTSTLVWTTERGIARVLARVPRLDDRAGVIRLARGLDGRSLALVVDGDPPALRTVATRFALPIDIESGARGDVVALGLADFSDRAALPRCDDGSAAGSAGWVIDAALPAGIDAQIGASSFRLAPVLARVRYAGDGSSACFERLAAGSPNAASLADASRGGRGPSVSRVSPVPNASANVARSSSERATRVSIFSRAERATITCESGGSPGRAVQP